MNRRARKLKHKRELERKYATMYEQCPCNVRLLRRKLEREAEEDDSYWMRKHPPRNNGWEYWKIFDISRRRKFAKKYSDKRIRQKYRQMIHQYDPEDVVAPHGADYEKEFDYLWTIW